MAWHLTEEHKAKLAAGRKRRVEADRAALQKRLDDAGVAHLLPPGWRQQWKLPRAVQEALDKSEQKLEVPPGISRQPGGRPRWDRGVPIEKWGAKGEPKEPEAAAEPEKEVEPAEPAEEAPPPKNPPPPWLKVGQKVPEQFLKPPPEPWPASPMPIPPSPPPAKPEPQPAPDYMLPLGQLIGAVDRCAQELKAIRILFRHLAEPVLGPDDQPAKPAPPPPSPEDVLSQALDIVRGLKGVSRETPPPPPEGDDSFMAAMRAELDEMDEPPPAEPTDRQLSDIWNKRMALWRSAKMWQAEWGPQPGHVGCQAPENLLLDHEIR